MNGLAICNKLVVGWNKVANATSYLVEYYDEGEWKEGAVVTGTRTEIAVAPGDVLSGTSRDLTRLKTTLSFCVEK